MLHILNEVKKYQAEARKIHVNCNGTLKMENVNRKINGYGIAQFAGLVLFWSRNISWDLHHSIYPLMFGIPPIFQLKVLYIYFCLFTYIAVCSVWWGDAIWLMTSDCTVCAPTPRMHLTPSLTPHPWWAPIDAHHIYIIYYI